MAPRQAKAAQKIPSKPQVPDKTLVIDNGAYTIKAGFASHSSSPQLEDCNDIPNCIARSRDRKVFIAAELDHCKDFGEMAFRRPVEKGYIVNWESERAIWEKSFFDKDAVVKCDPNETNLILTEAPNCPQQLQTNCDQVVFEEFGFASYYRCLGSSLNAYNDTASLFGDPQRSSGVAADCLLVLDSGYSHTTVTPLFQGRPIQGAIRRLSVGGKFLTNFLKDIISLRHYNVLDETHLVNQIKEDACFVSFDFSADLDATWKGNKHRFSNAPSSVLVDYVLPDYEATPRGFVRPHDAGAAMQAAKAKARGSAPREDVLPLGNERFVVPELLFRPDDVGMQEGGIVDTVIQSLDALPRSLSPAMLANIIVVGGNSLIPGFMERLEKDLRQSIPSEFMLRVKRAPDPIKSNWLGGARLANHHDILRRFAVTRQEYEEHGSNWLLRRFASST